MPKYDITITVDLEDDIEADRILDEVQKALHPLPRPDRTWSFAIGCHADVATATSDTSADPGSGEAHGPEMLEPGGDSLLPPGTSR